MLLWVDKILRPHVKNVPAGIVPYLLLDKYKCHYQGSVASAIENLGVEWDIIPGGCTSLVQPIDVGIGKPFKNRMRYNWEKWMVDQSDDDYGNTDRVKPAEVRQFIASWGKEAWDKIPESVVYNSWRHAPYSYFPEEPTVPTTFVDDDSSYEDDEEEEDEEDGPTEDV